MSSPGTHNGIVVGVDGSQEARVAVDWAAREAVLRKVPLTLVNVLPAAPTWSWHEVAVSDELDQLAANRGREILQEATAAAEETVVGAGTLTIREHVGQGNVVSHLTDLSEDADMLVVGSRGHGKVGQALLGSVSSGLLHHAHCPVAVVHDSEKASPDATAPIVVGIDGSPASERAVAIAFDEAALRGVPLAAVHVCSDPALYVFPNEEWMTFRPQADEVLAERLAGWQERYPDVVVERIVTRGRPARQLLEQADSAQLIVVGSRGHGGFVGLLLGSVSSSVAQSARVPVIVARQP